MAAAGERAYRFALDSRSSHTCAVVMTGSNAMSFPQVDPAPENAGAVRIGQWLVVGIVAMIVAAMLAFDYTRWYSTMANVTPSSHPSTTGAVPASPKIIAALCLNELR